ncbi:hypothetical protein [Actinosynnema sp. ALI-1.44]|uniref:hypothetical protein n=1 Tax=Actinosynnema sp. ALI-1.44 TaxID=1933779 RepID=UPI0011776BF1|nr:hypothetical protein [Actinosynnema sp. ALI-1.44]
MSRPVPGVPRPAKVAYWVGFIPIAENVERIQAIGDSRGRGDCRDGEHPGHQGGEVAPDLG